MIEYNTIRTSTKAHVAYRNAFKNAVAEGQKSQILEDLAAYLKSVSGTKLRWMKSSPRELAFRFFGFKREGAVWGVANFRTFKLVLCRHADVAAQIWKIGTHSSIKIKTHKQAHYGPFLFEHYTKT